MPEISVADVFLQFAHREARGASDRYRLWAEGVASDTALIARISQLVGIKRQPQLIFAAARWLGAPAGSFTVFREWLLAHWNDVRTEVSHRGFPPT